MNIETDLDAPEDFFRGIPLIGMNQLLYNFPDFKSDDFSKFLNEKKDLSSNVNYAFMKIYELILMNENEVFHQTQNRLKNLLNKLSLDALSILWESISKIFLLPSRKDAKISNYFDLIQSKSLQSLYKYGIENYSDNEKKLREIALLLIFFNKKEIKKISTEELSKLVIQYFNELEEIDLIYFLELNNDLKQILNKKNKGLADSYSKINATDLDDAESVMFEMIDVFQKGINRFESNDKLNLDTTFIVRNNNVYLSLNYLFSKFSKLNKMKRQHLFDSLKNDTIGNRIISSKEMEFLLIFHFEDFTNISWIQANLPIAHQPNF